MSSDRSDIPARDSYSHVADEYYDASLHPTCHNFNRLSRIFIGSRLAEHGDGRLILEVGAGESSAAPVAEESGYNLKLLTISDVSAQMLAHSAGWAAKGARLTLGDAENLGNWATPTNCIVAGLGDPYNTPQFWSQAHEILTSKGIVIFTMPSYSWAKKFRGSQTTGRFLAEFTTRHGKTVHMPSLVPALSQQIEMIERSGFLITDFQALGKDKIAEDPISPKLSTFAPVESFLWGLVAIKDA